MCTAAQISYSPPKSVSYLLPSCQLLSMCRSLFLWS
nr:MAG TPA: hypothetical protein [Caudoviricetes sp.]DAH53260.1 MAG TPA: hypothetical protein [Caudoviricetes sp.]